MKLRRELGLRDLTLFAIACIVGTRWIASAAHAGSGSILLWLLAAVFFLIPLAIATAALTARNPEAGGLYVWTRNDFGPWHGFLAFWVYWMGIAFWFPSAAMFYMSIAVSALGPRFEYLGSSRSALLAASLTAIWLALGTNLVGVKVGKWTENIGAIAAWLLAAILVTVAVLAAHKRGPATTLHLRPEWNWDTMGLLATIAYAMTGFEMAGLMGAEIRNPERDLRRAALVSSVFVIVFYAGATAAMLILLRPENISELNGIAQAVAEAARVLGLAWLPQVMALLVMATAVGQFGGLGAAVSRMPFAAGVDHLLPAAFARVHPRWATPYISILTLGTLASLLLIATQYGDTIRGAYQTLVSLMVIAGFLPYVYMFGSAWKARRRLSAVCGWVITVLAIACSVVPTAEIHNVWLFEWKLVAGTFAVIASAWVVYHRAERCETDLVTDPKNWPPLPLDEWQDTYTTLHMWTQIVGKIRMALFPPLNHWWNVSLYVNARGLTTGPIPFADVVFEIQFDFQKHELAITTSDGAEVSRPLQAEPVAAFYNGLMEALASLGISVTINLKPQEVADPIPFDQDQTHGSYDPKSAHNFWRILLSSAKVFERFRAQFIGKSSPVHFFWGSFDLASTRFSGEPAPPRKGAITGPAYSHEVWSGGFWPGGGEMPSPAYYAYAAPSPAGLANEPVRPAAAGWNPKLGEFILKYDDVREAASPEDDLFAFLESTYEAVARLAHWDRARLEK